MDRMAPSGVADAATLDALLGPPSQLARMLEIDHLDAHSRRLIGAARLAVVAVRQADGMVAALPVAARTELCTVADDRTLRLRRPAGIEAQVGGGVGALLFVPGIGETVRVNGRVAGLDRDELIIAVDEVIVHCAKAFIRSEFWGRPAGSPAGEDVTAILMASPLVCIGSVPRRGPGDVSPKGEMGAAADWVAPDLIAIPERPGNRRHDTFRNVVEQPQVGLLFLTPDLNAALHVQGEMRLMVDEAMNRRYAADGRPARAVSLIEVRRRSLLSDLGLDEAEIWDRRTWPDPATLPSIGQIMHDHILLHRDRSAAAETLKARLDVQTLEVEAQADYREGLW